MITENTPNRFTHAVLVTGSRTWDDEQSMRRTFNEVWQTWNRTDDKGLVPIRRPVLLSGHNPRGADAMAERLWWEAGFEIITFPADWQTHGRAAGVRRNAQMVDAAQVFRDGGVHVVCAAFLDHCDKVGCTRRHQQLLPTLAGHFSHGTIHCRGLAEKVQIPVIDTIPAASDVTARSS